MRTRGGTRCDSANGRIVMVGAAVPQNMMEAIIKARPSAAKGNYIKHITMTSTMGPGVKVDANMAQSMEETE